MGTAMSLSLEAYKKPSCVPRADLPSQFEPEVGFPKGRKPREMKATYEDMKRAGLEAYQMDYCAHHLIKWMACQNHYAPLATWNCNHEEHAFQECEFHDQILRMKEWERERRLLTRMKRKREAAGADPALPPIPQPNAA